MNYRPISFLLGAGFSAPMGYPIGNVLNESLQNFHKFNVCVSPDGKMFAIDKESKQTFYGNPYTIYLNCCIKLIEEYSKENNFDYEEFFEFLAQKKYLSIPQYRELCSSFITETVSLDYISSNIEDIYNQMVSYLLKDGDNIVWYDNQPYHIGKIDKYDGFLSLLKDWAYNRITHIHTLNHDMLFESFNRTDYISGDICDGFEELGSNYYGKLELADGRTYNVRLERFTANYTKNIRLYKLHGSLDYVLYHKTANDGISLIPEQYVKIKYGIGYDGLMRDTGSTEKYEEYPFAYHANFLTGTTSKIKKYEDPFLFKPLFNLFKKNLEKSEMLIIIGYGCKDSGINDIIKKHFKGDKIFIVDPYCDKNKTVNEFARRVGAKIIKTQMSDLRIECFMD